MQAQRKIDEADGPVAVTRPAVPTVDHISSSQRAIAPAPSPARLLREELAARLEASGACATIDCSPHPADDKWPMAYRLMLIAGASIALWTALIAGSVALLSI